MKASAQHKNARMAPRKIRPLARMLRGMQVAQAKSQLQFMPGKAPELVQQVLRSAVANAVNNFSLDEDSLVVSDVLVNKGLVMKRYQPVSKGMAHPILKRASHITVIVDDQGKAKKIKAKKTEIKEITADEYASQAAAAPAEAEEVTKAPADIKETPERDADHTKDKNEYLAFQKTKMMQQGGDQKKTHRRKSVKSK